MDKENNQVETNPSLLSITKESEDQSPKKPFNNNNNNNNTNDRLKRDEWSEGAVSSLLEAYESKWVLRNRAKLKGHDWEDVARHVSCRVNNTKSPKTQTQCKNKIESMKKRYRSESANADGSSWLLYPRLDLLLRGTNSVAAAAAVPPLQQHHHQQHPLVATAVNPGALMLMEPPSAVVVEPPAAAAPPPPPPPPPAATAQNSHGSNGVDGMAKEDGGGTKLLSDHVSSDKKANMETDSSTPAADLYSHGDKDKLRSKKLKMKMEKNNKRIRKREEWEIAESIRWLAEVMVRSEQARMDTMREIEKMRVEAEAKRGELDLKRTQIIANTQLEIAKLFAASGKPVDSSLRIGRN